MPTDRHIWARIQRKYRKSNTEPCLCVVKHSTWSAPKPSQKHSLIAADWMSKLCFLLLLLFLLPLFMEVFFLCMCVFVLIRLCMQSGEPGTQTGCFLPLSAYKNEEGGGGVDAAELRADEERDINKWMEGKNERTQRVEEAKLDTRKLLAFWHSSGVPLHVCARVCVNVCTQRFLASSCGRSSIAFPLSHAHMQAYMHAISTPRTGELAETPSVLLIKQK